ncbi:uncharacterized protein LTR77_001960 [Saxophila tyrrhenica]|uniref:Uncharacterized protein n=1 Tax=Saxophila tyrrhenica TaxID=1690608 RepID=A0AAV9PH71_9PEZI|nr:hypothetical protein LTR77_001960 [Saxophila tyrrhenica]
MARAFKSRRNAPKNLEGQRIDLGEQEQAAARAADRDGRVLSVRGMNAMARAVTARENAGSFRMAAILARRAALTVHKADHEGEESLTEEEKKMVQQQADRETTEAAAKAARSMQPSISNPPALTNSRTTTNNAATRPAIDPRNPYNDLYMANRLEREDRSTGTSRTTAQQPPLPIRDPGTMQMPPPDRPLRPTPTAADPNYFTPSIMRNGSAMVPPPPPTHPTRRRQQLVGTRSWRPRQLMPPQISHHRQFPPHRHQSSRRDRCSSRSAKRSVIGKATSLRRLVGSKTDWMMGTERTVGRHVVP